MSQEKKPPRGFGMFRREAEKIIKNPEYLDKTMDAARQKLDSKSAALKDVKGEVLPLFRMIKAYSHGDYRKIPWKTLVTAVGGVLYFLNPMDLVPDFLFGIGLVDDATVLAFCLGALKTDLDSFKKWEQNESSSPSPS